MNTPTPLAQAGFASQEAVAQALKHLGVLKPRPWTNKEVVAWQRKQYREKQRGQSR